MYCEYLRQTQPEIYGKPHDQFAVFNHGELSPEDMEMLTKCGNHVVVRNQFKYEWEPQPWYRGVDWVSLFAVLWALVVCPVALWILFK